MTYPFDEEKFKDVVHFIIDDCKDERDVLGKIKLNKILYFADMIHFMWKDAPLTGARYVRQPFGPVASALPSALEALQQEGRAEVATRSYFGLPKTDFVNTAPFSSNRVSEDEKALLREVIALVCRHSAKVISELSHNAAWENRPVGAQIPYETAYSMKPVEITERDVAWAYEELEKLKAQRRAAS